MSVETKPVAAFILSLMAGVFIMLGALVMWMFTFGVLNMMTGMMSGMQGSMGMAGMMTSYGPILTLVGLVSGAVVILGAIMVFTRPSESQVWGALVLAFSLVSVLGGMGGFFVGLILGVVGGVLALTWKPGSFTPSRS